MFGFIDLLFITEYPAALSKGNLIVIFALFISLPGLTITRSEKLRKKKMRYDRIMIVE